MDLFIPTQLPKLHLLAASRRQATHLVNLAIARLAAGGPVRVLDFGNRLDAYGIARHVRLQTPNYTIAMERISIARAFTCYQAATLLAGQPALAIPTLALDLLTGFADENVSRIERSRLLGCCITALETLAAAAPVLVTTALPVEPDVVEFFSRLETAAGQTWRLEPVGEAEAQERLF